MNTAVFFTVNEVAGAALEDHTAVVIDVLRASSTIVAALACSAQAIFPVVSTEEAIKLATSLGRDFALLAGERKGLKIDGFDLGNSPREFTLETVAGKQVVMTTTNGTRALVAAQDARRLLVGSLVNLAAVVDAVADAERLAIICAGTDGRFAIEDALCAGLLIQRLEERLGVELELDDAGRTAHALATQFSADPYFLAESAAGRALGEIGLAEDVSWCARVDAETIVPEVKDRVIRSGRGGA